MVTSQINFKFDRCNPNITNNCRSKQEIDEFMSDLAIMTYTLT